MTIIFGIIIAILIFSIIVLVHEWGHFASARFFGVKVEEFGLGIPPRAKKIYTDKKGTLYSLNWLPLGGFVKLFGESPTTFLLYDENKKFLNNEKLEKFILENKEIFDKTGEKISENDKKEILEILQKNKSEESFSNKKAWQQSIILLAGIFMNFILAFFIFFILFLIGVKPIGINDKIQTSLELKLIPNLEQALDSGFLQKNDGVILSPVSGSLAEKSGILKGDIILEINSTKVNSSEKFLEILKENKGKEIFLKKDCSQVKEKNENCIENISIKLDETGKIGSYISENIIFNKDFEYKFGVIDSAKFAFIETKNQVLLTFQALGNLAKKIFNPETKQERQEAIDSMSGPIGLVNFISTTFSAGVIFLLVIGALISINLGVFNLLPIPALDGGRFLFVVINASFKKIFGKNFFGENTENLIHFTFFMILIALSLIIGYNDIIKIFQ